MAKEKQDVEPYWGEKLLEGYALATDAPAAEGGLTMDRLTFEGNFCDVSM